MHSKLKVPHAFSKIEPYPQTCCQFHASCLTVSWKLPQHKTEVMTQWSQHNHVISKDDRGQPETIEPNSLHLWLNLETLWIKLWKGRERKINQKHQTDNFKSYDMITWGWQKTNKQQCLATVPNQLYISTLKVWRRKLLKSCDVFII